MDTPPRNNPPLNTSQFNIPPMYPSPMDIPTETFSNTSSNTSYAVGGKIMLTAVIVLFSVLILMFLLHLYARWYLERARNRHVANHRRDSSFRRTHLIFYAAPDAPSTPCGLDPFVLASLPVFNYAPSSSDTGTELKDFRVGPQSAPIMLECAVCLSEFEEGEKVRLLPKCNHCFHLHCIDMWFYSHATCPLCRSSVEKFDANATCHLPLGDRRKVSGMGTVRIEVPRRTEFEAELIASSPASYRSPAGRLLSLKRILSMGRRSAAVSPSGGAGPSCDSAELDLECGASESTLQRSRAQTPR